MVCLHHSGGLSLQANHIIWNGNFILPSIWPIQCQFTTCSMSLPQIISDLIMLLLPLLHWQWLCYLENDCNVSGFHFWVFTVSVVLNTGAMVRRQTANWTNKGKVNSSLKDRNLFINNILFVGRKTQTDKSWISCRRPQSVTSISEHVSFHFLSKPA